MRPVPKRIGIFGNFGIGNFGNDATLESMLLFLKQTQPDAELTCVCTVPEKVHRDHGIPALPCKLSGHPLLKKFADWIHAVRTVRKFDVLIVPGTGILCDFCSPPSGMPYTIFRWCLAAKLCGTSVAFVSVGAGPVHHPISRWLIKRTASMARYRSYRNKFSKEFLNSLGVNTREDPIYPDIAFRLPSPPIATQQSAEVRPLIVGIGAMTYYGWRGRRDDKIYEEYLRNVAEFVIWLLDRDYRVRILMGDELDQKAVDDLRRAVAAERPFLPPGVLIAEPAHSGQEVMRQMIDTDLVISSRFHHLVFALMLGKLCISTGYAEYFNELLAEMGLGAFCQHSEHIEIESLITQFTELISNRDRYEATIRDTVTSARERLAYQDSVFTSQFLEAACHERRESIRSGRKTPMSL